MIEKTCRQCNSEFTVEDDDLAFYKKISPTFDGKTFEIPAPTMCPQCRTRLKLSFRNESKFFKIKSILSGKELISQCSPETKFKIYEQAEWASDKWDPMDYGRDFDPSRPFFEQFYELNLDVPMPHASLLNNENSEYIGNASDAKDCYLISNSTNSERCMYGVSIWYSRDCLDCYKIFNCENCYQVTIGYESYSCFYSKNIHNCTESYFLDSCVGCKNCFACANLNNKQYWAFNKPSSKEEIEKMLDDFAMSEGARATIIKKSTDFLKNQPKRYAQITSSENSTGNYIDHCKNVKNSFFITEGENIKYSTNLSDHSKDVYDCCFVGMDMERIFNSVTVGINITDVNSCVNVYSNCRNVFYSIYCIEGSSDLFGCVGLKHKQYCILNKQYSKDEYEKTAVKIIERMIEDGKWGEFFPASFSHYGYNDTLANYFFPLKREEALKIGANWTEKDYSLKFEGDFYEPNENIFNYNPQKSSNAKSEIEKALAGTLQCRLTKRPYKLVSSEILFNIKNNLPLPDIHPEKRQALRFSSCNPFQLWHRKCMNEGCENEFETTYAPERKERVYCESCYQQSVI